MSKFQFVLNEGLYYGKRKVADFDNKIAKIIQIENIQSGQSISKTIYEIAVTTKEGNILPAATVSNLSNIRYFETWSEIQDADLTKRQRKLLECRLQETATNAISEKQLICDRSGFIEVNGQRLLIAGKSCIGDSKIKIDLNGNLKHYEWRNANIMASTHAHTLKLLLNVSPKCSELLTAALLCAVAKPFFKEAGVPVQFCINLYGKSGTYKTSLLKAITDILTKPELLWGSFSNDSKKQILEKIKQAYGFVFILDDYHPTACTYEKQKQLAIKDAVARQLDCDYETAFVAMTSEFLDGCFSLQDRLLQLEIQPVDLNLLSELKEMNSQIACFVVEFLKVLVANVDDVLQYIRKRFEDRNLERHEVSARLNRNGEFLKIASELCSRYLLGDEKTFTTKVEAALEFQKEIQSKHLKSIKRFESVDDFVKATYEVLNSEIYEVCTANGVEYQCHNNQIYIKLPGILYVTKNALRYGMRLYYGTGEINMAGIVKALHENDILLEDVDARTKKFHECRHLCLSIDALFKYMAAVNGNTECRLEMWM